MIIAVPQMMTGYKLVLIKCIRSSSSNAYLQGLVCLPWWGTCKATMPWGLWPKVYYTLCKISGNLHFDLYLLSFEALTLPRQYCPSLQRPARRAA